MTTPVTTSELFTLTGVFSCANAGWVARMAKATVNTASRKMVLFISASHNSKAFPAHLYSPTWGVLLSTLPILALFGVLFTMPQYFQGVAGTDAMGSGLRLLPLIGGLLAGAGPAAPLPPPPGAKVAPARGSV